MNDSQKWVLKWVVVAALVLIAFVIIGNLIPDDDDSPRREERERSEFCQQFPEECVPPDEGEFPAP